MKYIIVAKNDYLGTSTSDAKSPTTCTEICTELIIMGFKMWDLYNDGRFTNEDTIVTHKERSCLYTKTFKNVIDYQDFKKLNVNPIDVIDLCHPSNFENAYKTLPYRPVYQNWERDKKNILNVDYSNLKDYNVDKPFICLAIRKRGAWPEKNMSDSFWKSLIELIKENNINCFVFGKETESFDDGNLIQHVKNYRDWCSILNNKNCKHILTTMTGAVYPALILGAPDIKMTIIDNTKLMALHGHDPSFYNDCVNFSKVDINFIYYIPSPVEFLSNIGDLNV